MVNTLSENMKRVICALTLYPDDTISVMSKKVSINNSTASTYIHRIKERNLVSTKYIPEFFNINSSAVKIISGKYKHKFQADMRKSIIDFITYPTLPFFTLSDYSSFVTMSFHFLGNMNSGGEFGGKISNDLLSETIYDVNVIWYMTDTTTVTRYFDFFPILSKTFNVYLPSDTEQEMKRWSINELRETDKKLLSNLILKPGLSDFHRSQIMNISHPTVTKSRKKLLKYNLIKKLILPNLRELNFSVISWTCIKLDENNVKKKSLWAIYNQPNNILCIHDFDNIFILSIYKDFQDMVDEQKRMHEHLEDSMISFNDVKTNYLSIEDRNYHMNFDPEVSTNILLKTKELKKDILLAKDPENYFKKIFEEVLPDEKISIITKEFLSIFEKDTSELNPVEKVRNALVKLMIKPNFPSCLDKSEKTDFKRFLMEKLYEFHFSSDDMVNSYNNFQEKRLIVIEDSKNEVQLLIDMLEHSNFSIVGNANSTEEAFTLYKDLCENGEKPDIVVMNTFIDNLNIDDTIKIIKDYDPSVYIIALTSTLNSVEKENFKRMGVDKYLTKPVTKLNLFNALNKSLVNNN
jgi:CheY-like chemotaxis protein